MTTEEFTGHLLAALHGPKADEIVDRIMTVVTEQLSDPAAARMVGDAVGAVVTNMMDAAGIGDMQKVVLSLTMYTLAAYRADAPSVGQHAARERMRWITEKIALAGMVKDSAREAYGETLAGSDMEGLLDD